jgi:anti-sigma regulatory factor (Ser/Thr protein kinase)
MKELFLISIDPERIPDVSGWVESICRNEGLPALEAYQIKTCVTEAINNAVEHGYGFGGGNIGVAVKREGRKMIVEVSNCAGPAPIRRLSGKPPRPDAERGRGWAIIRAWAEEATTEHRLGRTVVRFAKTLPS